MSGCEGVPMGGGLAHGFIIVLGGVPSLAARNIYFSLFDYIFKQ